MRMILATFAVFFSIAGPSSAQSVGDESGIKFILGRAPKTAEFVAEVAISSMYEIAAGKLATERADDPTKTFAEQMVADHVSMSSRLKVAHGEALPTQLDSARQGNLDTLTKLTGADFTREYRSQQVIAHKDAVSLFQRYARGGGNLKLRSWAAKTLPTLKQHLQTAEKLNRELSSDAR